jgi:hypothetical protein
MLIHNPTAENIFEIAIRSFLEAASHPFQNVAVHSRNLEIAMEQRGRE